MKTHEHTYYNKTACLYRHSSMKHEGVLCMKQLHGQQQLWISGKPTEVRAQLRKLLMKAGGNTKMIELLRNDRYLK